jgi:UDP-N-acetylmuramoylalanine--D-glutamate ligase
LRDVPIEAVHCGGHRNEDFRGAELVVVNPAVRPSSPWLVVARNSGAELRTELELFCQSCAGRIAGVTGSNGKSTTAAMIAAILQAAGRRVFLGGNIGVSLLDRLPEIQPSDWVVLEISSFQLWHASRGARMPDVAVVTNCTPNHLDWHDDSRHYAAAKQRILRGQKAGDVAVLNPFDPEVATWWPLLQGRRISLPRLETLSELPLPGEHNRIDAACAVAATIGAGCDLDAIRQGLLSFRSLPQRLELIAEIDGCRFFNDSTATTPESTIAALRALDMPVWLMAGGKNKGFDFRVLAQEIVRRARGAAFFGASAAELQQWASRESPDFPVAAMTTMAEALAWCRRRARRGEAILLSPACASTDQYRNFRERGERFAALLTKTTVML